MPHINFDLSSVRKGDIWISEISISNAGDEPAYNVYVFLYSKSAISDSYSIQSLGGQGIKRGTLGIRDSLHFENKDVMFDDAA